MDQVVAARAWFVLYDYTSTSLGVRIMKKKLGSSLVKGSLIGLCLTGSAAQAALVIIPQSSLNNSPGVYTAGGYYTDDLGPNIVTTGGGATANTGQADGRNDDGYMALDLGFNVTFFGTTYTSLFINNNGNVSFGSGISAYVPTGPTGANDPVISPFFADVDTTNSTSGVVHYNLTSDQLVVTWDNVGRFNSQVVPPGDSFQLVLRSDGFAVPTGEGLIGFFYEDMGWELTDTSVTAAVGFGDGLGNAEIIQGSNTSGMANAMNDKYIWFDANLDVVPQPPTNGVPEPETLALMGVGLAALGIRRRRTTK
jgi:hypothetical protein